MQEIAKLKDVSEIRQLIIDNPDLPLIVAVSKDLTGEDMDYNYSIATNTIASVDSMTVCEDKKHDTMLWLTKEEFADALSDIYGDNPKYRDMSDKEFEKVIQEKVNQAEFTKAIVIYAN
ncbi:MAG: hypothetical protein Q4F95_02345 [Oscillospiraceae bacterium]|nr:hypothetical protein [Oscillospiraceae bacterium]